MCFCVFVFLRVGRGLCFRVFVFWSRLGCPCFRVLCFEGGAQNTRQGGTCVAFLVVTSDAAALARLLDDAEFGACAKAHYSKVRNPTIPRQGAAPDPAGDRHLQRRNKKRHKCISAGIHVVVGLRRRAGKSVAELG